MERPFGKKQVILEATIKKKIYVTPGKDESHVIKNEIEAWQDELIGKYVVDIKHS